jgi:exonuclease SbcC
VLLQEREQRLAEHQALHNGNLAEQLDATLAALNQQLADSEKHCAELRARPKISAARTPTRPWRADRQSL